MMKIVCTRGGCHDDCVANVVQNLQSLHYNVTKVERKSRDWILFGSDVTHITYEFTDKSRKQ